MTDAQYSVYILCCGDDSYYTGIALDVERRIVEHESGRRGSKYLKGRGPLTLVYSKAVGDRSAASRIEYRIKQLHRSHKEALIDGRSTLPELTADQDSAAG